MRVFLSFVVVILFALTGLLTTDAFAGGSYFKIDNAENVRGSGAVVTWKSDCHGQVSFAFYGASGKKLAGKIISYTGGGMSNFFFSGRASKVRAEALCEHSDGTNKVITDERSVR